MVDTSNPAMSLSWTFSLAKTVQLLLACFTERRVTSTIIPLLENRSPLLYYAMDSWFVRMTAVKERLLEFNDGVEWAPDWVGEGRFGEWLRNVKDWAISRERYWGTPLPVWRDEDGNMKCVGSIAELQAEVAKANAAGFENPECPDDVDLHRPVVDAFTLVSDDGKPMHREPFVMDCWFDSGCAPFAQWHHPFDENKTFDLPSQSITSVKVLTKLEDGSTRFSLYPQLCSIHLHTSDAYRLD